MADPDLTRSGARSFSHIVVGTPLRTTASFPSGWRCREPIRALSEISTGTSFSDVSFRDGAAPARQPRVHVVCRRRAEQRGRGGSHDSDAVHLDDDWDQGSHRWSHGRRARRQGERAQIHDRERQRPRCAQAQSRSQKGNGPTGASARLLDAPDLCAAGACDPCPTAGHPSFRTRACSRIPPHRARVRAADGVHRAHLRRGQGVRYLQDRAPRRLATPVRTRHDGA